MELKKNDKVQYNNSHPYKLGNGQEVTFFGEELIIRTDVIVQDNYFNVVKEAEVKKEKTIDEMNKEELLKFAEENNIEVDNRKGEKKLLVEIKDALNKK